jgi:hypothetical protein
MSASSKALPIADSLASWITKQRSWEGGKRSTVAAFQSDPERAPAGLNPAKD